MIDFRKIIDFTYLTTPPEVEFTFFYWFLGLGIGLTILGILIWFYFPRFFKEDNPTRFLLVRIGQISLIVGGLELLLLFLRNQDLVFTFWRLIFLLINLGLILGFLWLIIFYLTTFRKLKEEYLIKIHRAKYLP